MIVGAETVKGIKIKGVNVGFNLDGLCPRVMVQAEAMGAHTKKERADCNPMQSGRVEERSNSSWSNGSKQERRKQQLLIRAGDQKNAAER
ncbi:hypothetical protein Tco_1323477 [Tanacetum coccineum]